MADLIQYEYQNNFISFEIDEEIMVNATQMAKPFGKRVVYFLENQETKEFIKSLESRQSVRSRNSDFGQIVITVRGGNVSKQGTWMHRQLAIRFAMWLNADFAVWVTEKIDTLMQKGSVSLTENAVTKNDLLDIKNYIDEQNQTLKQELKAFIEETTFTKQDFVDNLPTMVEFMNFVWNTIEEMAKNQENTQKQLNQFSANLLDFKLDTTLLTEAIKRILASVPKNPTKKEIVCLYLLEDEIAEHHKFGISTDVPRRSKELGRWQDLKVLHKILVGTLKNALIIERLLMRFFAPKRIGGEWFKLSDSDIILVKSL